MKHWTDKRIYLPSQVLAHDRLLGDELWDRRLTLYGHIQNDGCVFTYVVSQADTIVGQLSTKTFGRLFKWEGYR